ncbi:MAG: integration host factor subunit beta [Bacteroidales bacterium]|nr:integration host factor subunit beta [Bacteroidales bacterium]
MTKAEIVAEISSQTGVEKITVQAVVESFMDVIKNSLESGENVYLRGFGSFIIKHRKQKTGQNIAKKVKVVIPAHNVPVFKPSKIFADAVRNKTK